LRLLLILPFKHFKINRFFVQVVIFAMFIATIVKKPDQQVLDSVDSREIKEADKQFLNVCSENLGEQ